MMERGACTHIHTVSKNHACLSALRHCAAWLVDILDVATAYRFWPWLLRGFCKLLSTFAWLLKWHLRWWRTSCFNLKRRGGDHTVSRAWFGAEVGKRRGQQKQRVFFFCDFPSYFPSGKKENQGSTFADGSDNSVYRLRTGSDWSKGNRQIP